MSPTSPATTNGGIDVLTPSLASDMSSLSLDPTGYSGGVSYNASTVSILVNPYLCGNDQSSPFEGHFTFNLL